jgi:hypothetical protein
MLQSVIRRLLGEPSLPVAALTLCRVKQNPIIRADMLPGKDGANINGPSLICVPDWVPSRLGQYYLYFAHHRGSYIRLAFADRLKGPWSVYRPGTLQLTDATACRGHISSPDVHVDEESKKIRMYFHGALKYGPSQASFIALSEDGLRFSASEEVLGKPYLRAVPWAGQWIGMAKGGVMYRSIDGLTAFEQLVAPAFPIKDEKANSPGSVRHVALQVIGSTLSVYYTRIGDAPESILRSVIKLDCNAVEWQAHNAELVARPEMVYEGADLPVRRSRYGPAKGREHALRDPAIYVEDGRVYLLYSIAGESGIALAELQARN